MPYVLTNYNLKSTSIAYECQHEESHEQMKTQLQLVLIPASSQKSTLSAIPNVTQTTKNAQDYSKPTTRRELKLQCQGLVLKFSPNHSLRSFHLQWTSLLWSIQGDSLLSFSSHSTVF